MNASNVVKAVLASVKDNKKPTVYFVVNVDGETLTKDYENPGDSILIEYLREYEYNDMISAFKQNGFGLKIFYNENDFINYVIKNTKELEQLEPIVFNLARNGKGLNKKALIPAFCNFSDISITGSGAYHVCLGRHKYHVNSLLRSHGIPVANSWLYTKNGWLMGKTPPKDLRIIAKPAFESASRGISSNSIAFVKDGIEEMLQDVCKKFKQDVIVQEFISGYEVGVPVIIDSRPYPLLSVGVSMGSDDAMGDKIITFDDAFNETYSFYNFSEKKPKISEGLQQSAIEAAMLLGLEQYCRIDFRVKLDGSFYIMDTSTHPFIIKHSAFAFAFNELGFSFSDLFAYLVYQRQLKHN